MNLNTSNNTSKEIENKSIKTLAWFIKRQEEIQKQAEINVNIWKTHKKLLDKVLSFKKVLCEYFGKDIDPIAYLDKLYFEENLSIESMLWKIKEIYITQWETKHFYNSSNSMQKLLKEVLNWKLRNYSESKTTKVYKNRSKENVLNGILKRQNERKVAFLWWYIKSSNSNFENFQENKFNNFTFKYEKIIYLLENVLYINKENFQKLKDLDIWNKFIADRFNEIFDELIINFTIWHKDIKRVFEKYK